MSDDLKSRLRSVGGVRHDGATRWYINPDGPEAADRIEKLEADLETATMKRLLDSDRIEKLEAALRFIAGPSTVEFVDGTYEISETKMLSTYRRRAKRALEGNYDD